MSACRPDIPMLHASFCCGVICVLWCGAHRGDRLLGPVLEGNEAAAMSKRNLLAPSPTTAAALGRQIFASSQATGGIPAFPSKPVIGKPKYVRCAGSGGAYGPLGSLCGVVHWRE